jgi:hypothetical protein
MFKILSISVREKGEGVQITAQTSLDDHLDVVCSVLHASAKEAIIVPKRVYTAQTVLVPGTQPAPKSKEILVKSLGL